jgi:hypothetical protein
MKQLDSGVPHLMLKKLLAGPSVQPLDIRAAMLATRCHLVLTMVVAGAVDSSIESQTAALICEWLALR